jgi:poly(3-hydroxybutyrate) depolymerase
MSRTADPSMLRATTLALLVGVLAAGCQDDDEIGPGVCPGNGYSTVSLQVGQTRSYVVYKPASLNASSPVPVLLFFHGLTSNAEQQKAFTALDRTADARGFILVLAESGDGNWGLSGANNPEFPYVDAVVNDLGRCFNVDAARIYAAGHSNGAQFVYRLLEHRAGTFAGFAAFAGSAFNNIVLQSVTAPTPRAFVWVHGAEDELFAWEHAIVSLSTRAGARDNLVAQWNCTRAAGTGPWEDFDGCRGGVKIRSLVVPRMRHVMWPSPSSVLPPPQLAFDANEMMWDFLASFRR